MRSVRTRLHFGLVVSLILTLLLMGVGGSIAVRMLVEDWLETRLAHDAETLLVSLQRGPAGHLALSPSYQNPIYQRSFSGHYYRIQTGHQVLRSRSLWDEDLGIAEVAPGEVRLYRMRGPAQQLLLVRVAGYEKQSVQLTLAVAEDLSPIRAAARRFQGAFLLFSLLALTLLLAVQRLTLARGLAPLAGTQAEIGELRRGDRSALTTEVPEEIRPLVEEINALIQLLQQRLQRSRNSLGNLAHALKTPLAVMRQLAERPQLAAHPQLQEQLCQQVDELHAKIEAELRRARLSGRGYRGRRVDLDEDLPALVEVLRTAYSDKGLRLQASVSKGLHYHGDKEDLLELAGNLLDNACKWARSEVRFVASGDGQLLLRVEDDGPGRDEDELEHLRQRGVRVDEDVVPGHGLGLAIAQEIVESLEGELILGRSEQLGGFLAEVRLPLAGRG